jgi:retron-type reverse transcriptase
MSTSKRRDLQKKISACLTADLGSIFVTLDPFAPSFAESLKTNVNAQVVHAWPHARACLPGLAEVSGMSEVNALRQVWAVATQSDLKLAVLYRSASLSSIPEITSTLAELAALSVPKITDEVAICLIGAQLTGRLIPPSLAPHTELKPGLRLRYGLAHCYAITPTAMSLLQLAATHPNASDFLRARELGRAVKALALAGQPLEPLKELEFYRLSKKAVRLAVGSEELRQHLLPPIIQKGIRPELFGSVAYNHKPKNIQQLERLARSLTYLDFESVVEVTQALPLDGETKRLAVDVLPVLNRQRQTIALDSMSQQEIESVTETVPLKTQRARVRKDAPQKWDTLAPAVFEWFDALPAKFRPPKWWGLPAVEVAQQIILGEIPQTAVHQAELQVLQRSWLKPINLALFKAKRSWALESAIDLPAKVTLAEIRTLSKSDKRFEAAVVKRLAKSKDPRPALAIIKKSKNKAVLEEFRSLCKKAELNWGSWILPAMGSTVWSNRFIPFFYSGSDILLPGINFLLDSGTAYEPMGFKRLMSEGFAALNESVRTDRVAKLVTHLKVHPEFIKTTLSHFPEEILERVLKHRGLPPSVIEFIDEAQPARILYLKWCLKLRHVASLAVLQTVLSERFDQPELIPWHSRWLELEGTEAQRRLALVLAARRSPKRLVALAKRLGVDSFEKGLKQAIATLPTELGRERARLELVLALGVQAAPALAHVLAIMKHDAAAGHKLDHAYYRHELPKQSGGTRTISAPEKFLKFTQRQILDRLLTPLGAHDCAYGFVKGRSIADNARPHINQQIVTNADVRNCFPSVRWSLVLGVLRRDLGKQLSPRAISYLVDICTAEGGMPIGGPTSPALLNRVLLKTDQILLEAATKRNCVYTRYADDLTFSGDKGAIELLGVAKRTLGQIGLALDPKKTNIFRRGRRQMVTGLVVNEQVSIPRRLRRRLRAAVHRVQGGEVSHWHNLDQTTTSLQGRLAFLQMVHGKEALALKKRLTEVVVKKPSKKKTKSSDA